MFIYLYYILRYICRLDRLVRLKTTADFQGPKLCDYKLLCKDAYITSTVFRMTAPISFHSVGVSKPGVFITLVEKKSVLHTQNYEWRIYFINLTVSVGNPVRDTSQSHRCKLIESLLKPVFQTNLND